MASTPTLDDPVFKAAFVKNEREVRISTGKLASALVVFLMPLGVLLDYFVYPEQLGLFLCVRLVCSVLAIGLWHLHGTAIGKRHYHLLGLPIALLPAAAISFMIYMTEGPMSPY